MKKNITKEQIVLTTLELLRNQADLRSVNLREIARTLGCAHTNLYNYFLSYNDLLWETYISMLKISMELLEQKLAQADTPDQKLTYFFEGIVEIYLNNKGWFRLAWHEFIGNEPPQKDFETIADTNKQLNQWLAKIWKNIYGELPDADATKRVLHNTHCYIVGEISNHILGRGLIEDEAVLTAYITREATQMFILCLANHSL